MAPELLLRYISGTAQDSHLIPNYVARITDNDLYVMIILLYSIISFYGNQKRQQPETLIAARICNINK